MLILQYTKNWKTYSLWIVGTSVALGFALTPLIVKLGYIRLTNWSDLYATLAFIFIGVFSKSVYELIMSVEAKYILRKKPPEPRDNKPIQAS